MTKYNSGMESNVNIFEVNGTIRNNNQNDYTESKRIITKGIIQCSKITKLYHKIN